jgi:hypothetical protein
VIHLGSIIELNSPSRSDDRFVLTGTSLLSSPSRFDRHSLSCLQPRHPVFGHCLSSGTDPKKPINVHKIENKNFTAIPFVA